MAFDYEKCHFKKYIRIFTTTTITSNKQYSLNEKAVYVG